jgi:hypothetical protein
MEVADASWSVSAAITLRKAKHKAYLIEMKV